MERARYPQAVALFKEALRNCKKARDREGTYHCMRSLGDVYRMTGRFGDAVKIYTGAIAFAKHMHSPEKASDARIGLGLSLRAQGNWQKAIQLIRTSKKLYIKKKDRYGTAFALWAEAGTLRIKGDIPGALRTFRESYSLFKALQDDQGIGYCLCGLGGASRVAGRIKSSLNYYLAANRLFSDKHDTFGRAYSFCGIANAYRMLENYKNAFSSFAQATRLYRTIGDTVSYAYTLWGLGTAYKMIGKYQQARNYMMKAMQLFEETKDPRGIIYCRLSLGEILFLTGDKSGAEKNLESAEKTVETFRFGVEACHTKTLHRIIHGRHTVHYSVARQKMGGADRKDIPLKSCYHRLGLNLRFHSLPLNLP
jgi:tetratricopeptide (TPR) repeat protein